MDIEGKGAIAEVCFSVRQIHPPPPSISFTHHLPIIYAAYCFRCDEIMQPEFLHVLRRFLIFFFAPLLADRLDGPSHGLPCPMET